jgi:Na+/H+ antiporter NhaD/arsenite permease-like protein
MSVLILLIFIAGYLAIAFEQSIRLNKAASALITGALCWTVYILQAGDHERVNEQLLLHLGDIASILFFLLGAMTIVELVDAQNGFDLIARKLNTRSKSKLLVLVALITFFLSALLDNLTTAIVMTSLCSKLLAEKKDRLYFAGIIIIAANAGGAWSPLGDVTTTMLWIGGQISASNIILKLFVPSVFVCAVPVAIVAYKFRGQQLAAVQAAEQDPLRVKNGRAMLITGILMLLFVPVFKTVTHLPPFVGMILALGIIWIVTGTLNKRMAEAEGNRISVSEALQKIDSPSILFFLGILLAVAALQSFGTLNTVAVFLNSHLQNDYLIGTTLGLLSAVVDNVPLVAAAQGMYDLNTYPTDHNFWEFIALTTGTGGSAIIIGSAAGVAVMGMEAVSFIWYLKKISWLALLGFIAGIAVFLLTAA